MRRPVVLGKQYALHPPTHRVRWCLGCVLCVALAAGHSTQLWLLAQTPRSAPPLAPGGRIAKSSSSNATRETRAGVPGSGRPAAAELACRGQFEGRGSGSAGRRLPEPDPLAELKELDGALADAVRTPLPFVIVIGAQKAGSSVRGALWIRLVPFHAIPSGPGAGAMRSNTSWAYFSVCGTPGRPWRASWGRTRSFWRRAPALARVFE